MAIKIPSKNIYEINNPKIRDNVVDNVSVEQTIVKPNNEYEVSVYNGKFFAQSSQIQKSDDENETNSLIKSYGVSGSSIGVRAVWIANSGMINKNLYKFTLQIPRLLKNKFVSQVFYEKDKEGKNKISYAVYGDIEKGLCSRTATWEYINATSSNVRIVSLGDVIFEEHTEKEEGVLFNQDATIVSTIKGTPNPEYFETQEVVSTLNPNDTSYVAYYNGNDNHFDIEFYALCMFDTITLGNMYYGGAINGELLLQGEYKRHIPTQIEITVYGNTIGIDLTDGSVTYGNGNKPHSLSGNELLQDSSVVLNSLEIPITLDNTIVSDYKFLLDINTGDYSFNLGETLTYKGQDAIIYRVLEGINNYRIQFGSPTDVSNGTIENNEFYKAFYIYGQKNINITSKKYSLYTTEILANNVLSQYAKGKETATLLCDIADYYNESGEKIIDIKTDKMSFRLHDEVIPYVFGANGQDQPMSKYQDGTAKVFEVIGSNIIYDGAVWQELTLQEKISKILDK